MWSALLKSFGEAQKSTMGSELGSTKLVNLAGVAGDVSRFREFSDVLWFRAVFLTFFGGAELQRNIPVTRGIPCNKLIVSSKKQHSI